MMRAIPIALLIAACASRPPRPSTPPPPAPAPPVVEAEPEREETPTRTFQIEPVRIDVVTTDTGSIASKVYDARTLLDDGNDALMQRRFDEALAAYDHLLADFPESKLVVPAIYNAGLALEGKRDFGAAADRYRKLMAVTPKDTTDYLDAHFRLGRVLLEVVQYVEVERVFAEILDRDDLRPGDRIEALAWQGFAQLEQKDYAAAEDTFRRALAYYREIRSSDPPDSEHFVAMCQYYLAEIPDRQFREIPLRYPEEQLSRDLDQKSDRFLLAQDRYIKTVDYKNPYWATRAVYQIGIMYKVFWDAWMSVPIPADLNATEAKEYVKQVNEEPQLRRLLEKALLYHERNVAMAHNGNVTTEWSEASKVQADAVRRVIAMIQRGEYVTPGPDAAKIGTVQGGAGTSVTPADYLPGRVEL